MATTPARRLQANRKLLVNTLQPEVIMDHLIQEGVLSDAFVDSVRALTSRQDKVRALIDSHGVKQERGYSVLRKALIDEKYDHVVSALDIDVIREEYVVPYGNHRKDDSERIRSENTDLRTKNLHLEEERKLMLRQIQEQNVTIRSLEDRIASIGGRGSIMEDSMDDTVDYIIKPSPSTSILEWMKSALLTESLRVTFEPLDVAVMPNGNILVAGAKRAGVFSLHPGSMKMVVKIRRPFALTVWRPTSVCANKTDNNAWIGNCTNKVEGGGVYYFDADTASCHRVVDVDKPTDVAVTDDMRVVVAGDDVDWRGRKGRVSIYNPITGRRLHSTRDHNGKTYKLRHPRRLAVTGEYVLVTHDDVISAFSSRDLTFLWRYAHAQGDPVQLRQPVGIALVPWDSGQVVVSDDATETLVVLRTENGKYVSHMNVSGIGSNAIKFCDDYHVLASDEDSFALQKLKLCS